MNSNRIESHSTIDNCPRYDLTDPELEEASRDFLGQVDHRKSSAGFVCYQIDGNSRYANIGRTLEQRVFDLEFGNSVDLMESEYRQYEADSLFFVIFQSTTGKPAGVIRVIRNSNNGLKTLNDIEKEPLSLEKEIVMAEYGMSTLDSWDVGTLGVLPEFRHSSKKSSHWLSIMLYRALYKAARANDIEHLVSIIDKRAYKGMQMMGIPFKPILDSEAFSYLDSEESYALHGYTNDFYGDMDLHKKKLRASKPLGSFALRWAMTRLMDGKFIDKAIDSSNVYI